MVTLATFCVLIACGPRPTPIPSPPAPFSLEAPTPTPRPPGAPLRVTGHFTGDDAPIREVLQRFEGQHGVPVTYEASGDLPTLLLEQLEAGTVPDVLLLPVPDWLAELAGAGAIAPLAPAAGEAVRSHFGEAWVQLVTFEGEIYGVPLDANLKSLLWYRPAALDATDGNAPQSLDDLFDLATALEARGEAAFVVPGGAGWPLTDWFENVLLASAGPDLYDALIAHEIPWTDPRVEEAARRFVSLLREEWVLGGVQGAVSLPLQAETFQAALAPANPGAAMWLGQSSVTRGYAADAGLAAGEEYDIMLFPSGGGVIGTGSIAVATNDAPDTMALLAFLAQPESVGPWAERGGFVSPNRDLSLDIYPDEIARREAEFVVNATLFRYDLSDRLPRNLRDSFLPERLREMILAPERVPAILEEIERVATREQGSVQE